MKKLFAILLALIMVFSLAACDEEPCTKHTDADGNNLCDNCGATIDSGDKGNAPCTHNDADIDGVCDICGAAVDINVQNAASILSNAVSAQMKAAKSMKVVITDKTDKVSDTWVYEGGLVGADVINSVFDWAMQDTYEIDLTVTEDGMVNAKIVVTVYNKIDYRDSNDEDFEDTTVTTMYLIGDYSYTYDAEEDIYFRAPRQDEESSAMEATLVALTEGVTLTDDELATFTKQLSEAFVTSFGFKDGKGSISMDAKAQYDAIKAFFAEIDPEKDSIADVINKALAEIDPELTVNGLIDAVSEACDLTILEAYDAIDAWLTKKYETNLQELYGEIVNDPRFETVYLNTLKAQGIEDEETLNFYKEELTALKAIVLKETLSATVTEMGLAEASLYDVLMPIIMSSTLEDGEELDPESIPTKNAFFGVIKDMLALKVGEFEETVMPLFTLINQSFENNLLEKAEFKAEVSFTEQFAISEISIVSATKTITKSPSDIIAGKTETFTEDTTFSVVVSSFSPVAIPMEAPENFEDEVLL